jgi:hypothetical protein
MPDEQEQVELSIEEMRTWLIDRIKKMGVREIQDAYRDLAPGPKCFFCANPAVVEGWTKRGDVNARVEVCESHLPSLIGWQPGTTLKSLQQQEEKENGS